MLTISTTVSAGCVRIPLTTVMTFICTEKRTEKKLFTSYTLEAEVKLIKLMNFFLNKRKCKIITIKVLGSYRNVFSDNPILSPDKVLDLEQIETL